VDKGKSPECCYQSVTPAVVAQLRAIVGEPYVIYGEPAAMLDYAHDEVAGAEYAHMPEVVVKPATAVEISRLLRLANRERIPVTPRGAGSGLSCGAVPVYGSILLSLERMNRILEIDRENMVAVVEPGVVTNDINEAVNEYGLFYAGYPMSVELCFIGGNVAENAGGGRAIKYGVTGRYVLGAGRGRRARREGVHRLPRRRARREERWRPLRGGATGQGPRGRQSGHRAGLAGAPRLAGQVPGDAGDEDHAIGSCGQAPDWNPLHPAAPCSSERGSECASD